MSGEQKPPGEGGGQGGDGKPDIITVPEVSEGSEEKPTEKQLTEEGWSPEEIASAKEKGMVGEEGKPDGDGKSGAEDDDPEKGDKGKGGKPPAKKTEEGEEDDPEKEADKIKDFNANEKALYHARKKERRKRQDAEVDRDRLKLQDKANRDRIKELEAAILAGRKPKEEGDEGDEDPFADEYPDPDKGKKGKKGDKPLTQADLDRIEKEKTDKAAADHEAKVERAKKINEILDGQSEDARTAYNDFDTVVDQLTPKVLENINNPEKLTEWIPDPIKRRGLVSMTRDLIKATAKPEDVPDGEPNAADLAYEIGKLHPDYKAHPNGDKSGNRDGDTKNSKLQKKLNNAGKRSSAALSGGASKAVTVEEMTADDLLALPDADYKEFRRKYPQQYERILASTDG